MSSVNGNGGKDYDILHKIVLIGDSGLFIFFIFLSLFFQIYI